MHRGKHTDLDRSGVENIEPELLIINQTRVIFTRQGAYEEKDKGNCISYIVFGNGIKPKATIKSPIQANKNTAHRSQGKRGIPCYL
jgi:hypothetical protein